MAHRLAGKVAIITGAGSGIGRASAQLFAAEGAQVMCADIVTAHVEETARLIGAQAIAATVDVTRPADIERMVAQTLAAFGRLDVLYANAGIGEASNAIDMTIEQWDRMIAVNLTSVWLSAKYALPHMIAGGGGSIINQSSTAGLIGIPDLPHYSAAKTGVIGLTRQIAAEYGPRNIRCNAICPGTVESPSLRDRISAQAKASGQTIDQVEAAFVARQPMGRVGRVDEIASLAVYLASDESSFTTGTSQIIDGGWSN
jgi:2-keto-3-deoxy-L-fuconate dehydrogenase